MSESTRDSQSGNQQTQGFRAVVKAETIQTALKLVDALVDESHLYLEADGIRMPAVDPATVASVDVSLNQAAFEAYQAPDTHIGINLTRLLDIVGMADRGQLVELGLDQDTRKLEIRIGELEYTLALLDPETIRSPPDQSGFDVEFTATLEIERSAFGQAVAAADMVSDHIALGVPEAEDAFYAEAEGDTDDVSFAVPAEELGEYSLGEAHSLFSIDYLKPIERAMPRDCEVELRLGTEVPLAVTFGFAEEAGDCEYLISPRIPAN